MIQTWAVTAQKCQINSRTYNSLRNMGPSRLCREQLWCPTSAEGVQQIQATDRAFAAILSDGSVVTWGDPTCGGELRSDVFNADGALSLFLCVFQQCVKVGNQRSRDWVAAQGPNLCCFGIKFFFFFACIIA